MTCPGDCGQCPDRDCGAYECPSVSTSQSPAPPSASPSTPPPSSTPDSPSKQPRECETQTSCETCVVAQDIDDTSLYFDCMWCTDKCISVDLEKGFPFDTIEGLERYNDVCKTKIEPLDIMIDEFNQDNLWCSLSDESQFSNNS